VVITGEVGCGKTTLINYLLTKIEQTIQVGLVNTTHVTPTQFMRLLCQDFELPAAGLDKAEMMDRFYEYLVREYAENRRVVLIIDEAQNLSARTMEEVRMLSNLQSEKHHLLQIVMVGQPELRYKLQRRELRQFAQRVSVHYHLDGLRPEEVAEYLRFRLAVAGAASSDIFEPEAVRAIAAYSRGIPRVINIICDTALVYGFADGLERIGPETVESVLAERQIGGPPFTGGEEYPDAETGAPEPASAAAALDRLRAVESRLDRLEKRVEGVDEKLTHALRNRVDQDRVWVDLMKMVKDSLESRHQTLEWLNRKREGKKKNGPSKKRKGFPGFSF
jgi:general secretion pathway protein A